MGIATFKTIAVPAADLPKSVASQSGMLSIEDRRMRYGVARALYRGKGCIVETGIVDSTPILAAGEGILDNPSISQSRLPKHPIRGFCRVRVGGNENEGSQRTPEHSTPASELAGSVLAQLAPPVEELTKLYAEDGVSFGSEDVGPVEICFLDGDDTAAMSQQVMDAIVPKVLPGGYIVAERYFTGQLPHMRIFIESLSDKLRYLGEVDGAAVFQVGQPVALGELQAAYANLGCRARATELHMQAEARTICQECRQLLQSSRASLRTRTEAAGSAKGDEVERPRRHVAASPVEAFKTPLDSERRSEGLLWGFGRAIRRAVTGRAYASRVDTFPLIDERELPPAARLHPGMISSEERCLLYGLARDRYEGKGAIVDAGVFLGASTIALGCGLRDNPKIDTTRLRDKPIRSFERAVAGPNFARHARRSGLPNTPIDDSFEGTLRRQLEPVLDLTELTVGDIRDYSGEDIEGIEICFLDILKVADVTRHAMRIFFPRLVPGAVIVQQDYFFSDLPYIKVYNEALSDKLTYLGEARSSAVFEVRDWITEQDLDDAFAALENLDRSVQLHRRAEARTVNPERQYMMRLSRALLYVHATEPQWAERTFVEANRDFPEIAGSFTGRLRRRSGWRQERLQQAIENARATEARRQRRADRIERRNAKQLHQRPNIG